MQARATEAEASVAADHVWITLISRAFVHIARDPYEIEFAPQATLKRIIKKFSNRRDQSSRS